MRLIVLVISAALCAGLLGACGGDDEKKKSETRVYFGWLLGSEEVAGVAIEVDPASNGMNKVRAYVCDGRGEPEGKAVWFGGAADLASTTKPGVNAVLKSAGKKEDLVLEFVNEGRAQGSFTDEDGKRTQFVAYPAIDGAGIYEVTLDKDLHYTGTSTDGNELDAQSDEKGTTEGTIKTADGDDVDFTVRSLALATPAQLKSRGLASDYGKYTKLNQIPGEYVAVIAPGGSHWLGRSGNVRGGSAGVNIIGLDKKC